MTLGDKTQTQLEHKQYRFTELYKSASTLVKFAASLQGEQFQEFWLPCELQSDHENHFGMHN
jgi:hypothetical protein